MEHPARSLVCGFSRLHDAAFHLSPSKIPWKAQHGCRHHSHDHVSFYRLREMGSGSVVKLEEARLSMGSNRMEVRRSRIKKKPRNFGAFSFQ
jgi:hypothetical protein